VVRFSTVKEKSCRAYLRENSLARGAKELSPTIFMPAAAWLFGRERQQSDDAGALHSNSHLALVLGTVARNAPGNDLPAL
jgi:hypothetical protein